MEGFGKELILDIHNCDSKTFTRGSIKAFFVNLCKLIDMQREDLHFWDYKGQPEAYRKAPSHLKGVSAVQFIKTSNITIHTLDEMKNIYVNIFSCKDFDTEKAGKFTEAWFKGFIVNRRTIRRR